MDAHDALEQLHATIDTHAPKLASPLRAVLKGQGGVMPQNGLAYVYQHGAPSALQAGWRQNIAGAIVLRWDKPLRAAMAAGGEFWSDRAIQWREEDSGCPRGLQQLVWIGRSPAA